MAKERCPDTLAKLSELCSYLTKEETGCIQAFCSTDPQRGPAAMWGGDGLPAIFTLARIEGVCRYTDGKVKLKDMRSTLATSPAEAKYANHPAVLALLVLYSRGHETMEQQEAQWAEFKQELAERWDNPELAEHQWLLLNTHEKRAAHAQLEVEPALRRMFVERMREHMAPRINAVYGAQFGGGQAAATCITSSTLYSMITRSEKERSLTTDYIEATGLDEGIMTSLRGELKETVFTGRQSTITMDIMVRGIAKALWPVAKRPPKKRVLDALVECQLSSKVLPEPAQWCPVVAKARVMQAKPAAPRVRAPAEAGASPSSRNPSRKRRKLDQVASFSELMDFCDGY